MSEAREAARPERAERSERSLAADALRLATGRLAPAAVSPDTWPALHRVARQERLAPLAWLRAATTIAAAAGAETVDAWRRDWLNASVRAYALLAVAEELSRAVDDPAAAPIVLKGGPLAHRLYGDVSARPSTDLDLYVPDAGRAAVEETATRLGWRRVESSSSGDLVMVRSAPDGEIFLELHASLLGERLASLPVPSPAASSVDIDGVRLLAHDGPLLPAYLAAHLASHTLPPLLWWLDWHTLWRSTDAAGRDAARRAAAAAGLARYLRWAERRADALGRALDGDDAALDALGYGARRPRRDVHPFARHVVLAPSASAAVASLREWTRPSWAGERDGGLVLGTLRRLARHWRLLLPSEAPASALGTGASRTHDATEVIAAARTVVSAGGEMWLRVTGRSMTPTLGDGDSVLLSGPGGRVRPGDVVLAAAPRGPLLHRVRRVSGATVVTQGDACDTADGELESNAVVARAVAVRRGQVVAALTPTLRFGVGPLLRYCVRALRRSRRPAAARLWRA